MGAWIEILLTERTVKYHIKSLPLWERGLKYQFWHGKHSKACVAPLVGAWIEIRYMYFMLIIVFVAPLVGAWIEIGNVNKLVANGKSRSPCGSVD